MKNQNLTPSQKAAFNHHSINSQRKYATDLIMKFNWVGENERLLKLIATHGYAHVGENYYGVCESKTKKGVSFFLF